MLLVMASSSLLAQSPVHFEDVILPASGVWNGSDQSGFFRSGGMTFHNSYNAEWSSWNGFACTNHKDTLTRGFANQYSSIAGGGYGGSGNFAVAFDFGNIKITPEQPLRFEGMHLTNTTYAYLSMRDGDAYAKKFGGSTGTDPDYFRVRITGIGTQGDTTGTVLFYLADFRAEEPKEDYLVKEWTWVDLTSLGEVAHLRFALESSDTGSFGMNTPGYFCIDQINDRQVALHIPQKSDVPAIYPNPFTTHFYIDHPGNSGERPKAVTLTEASGRSIPVRTTSIGNKTLVTPAADLSPGVAILRYTLGENHHLIKMVRVGKR